MKRNFFILIIFFILQLAYSEEPTKDYQYYINLYIEKNYSIQAQQEKLNSAKWNKISYLGNLLPQVSINHIRNYKLDDGMDETNWSSTLSVSQILFAGFSALNTLFMAGHLEGVEEFTLAYKKLQTAEQGAALYFKCASLDSQVISLKEAVTLMQKRVDELKRRENLGKARISEVYSAQAKLSQLKSQLIQAQLELENSLIEFENQCGERPERFIYPEAEPVLKIPDSIIDDTVKNFPYVRVMEEQLHYYESLVSIQKGSFLPKVTLLADYNLGSGNYVATGPAIKLMANWEVFSGGSRLAKTISTESLVTKAKYELEDAKRFIASQIKKVSNNYFYSILKLKELKAYYEFNQKNLKEQQRDYLLGNVTNLEVLQAMMDLKDAKIAYDSGRISALQNQYIFKLYTGDNK